MRLFEWYLTVKTFSNSVVTFTNATNIVNDTAHGLRTGTGPVYLINSGGALPAELAENTPFFVIRVDDDDMRLATSFANALQETAITFSDDGTGTSTMVDDDLDAELNGVTKETEVASLGLLGDAADGAISLDAGALGYSITARHRNGAVAYSVQGTLSAGNVTIEMSPRGEV